MLKRCKVCKKEFEGKGRQIYCSEACKKKAYKFYPFSTPEATEKYREKVKEEENLSDSEFNYMFREHTASNKGMTVSEYNTYLEERKASKLGLTVKELRHFTYLAKKNKNQLYEELGIQREEYYKKLKD